MKPELEKKLFRKYPLLLRGKDKSPQETLMCWGISTGDGWFNLLNNLLSDIKKINEDLDWDIEVVQIKQKFGGLRFYMNGAPMKIHDLVSEAEEKSFKICEECGTTENVEHKAPTGYWRALCPDCWEEYLDEEVAGIKRKNLKKGD